MVFLCSSEVENIRMIKYLLRNFKVMSGIKVNFNKCSLVSLNIERGMQASMAEILCCSLEKLPLQFLGMHIDFNHKLASSWKSMVDRIKRRLQSGKIKTYCLGVEYTLVQTVLSAIPVYSLSFYLISKKVIKEITRVQRNFLLRVVKTKKNTVDELGGDLQRKIKRGGGVGNTKSEMGKWIEGDSLRMKVIKSRYIGLGRVGSIMG